MKRLSHVIIGILLLACGLGGAACRSSATSISQSAATPECLVDITGAVAPAALPPLRCGALPADIRERLAASGARFITLGQDAYAVVLLPLNNEPAARQRIVIGLPGSFDCAESVLLGWQKATAEQPPVLAAIQYGGNAAADDPEAVYQAIIRLLANLRQQCDLAEAAAFLYGFSRGAKYVYALAALDRAAPDRRHFRAFLADSGGWFDAVMPPPAALTAALDAGGRPFAGASFWLYCGGQDQGKCTAMAQAVAALEKGGAKVDRFYQDPEGRHGLLPFRDTAGSPAAIRELLEYSDSY